MRIRILAIVACLTASTTTVAWAQSSGSVDATVTITSGPLTVTAPDVRDLTAGSPGTDITGALGTVTVTDQRGQFDATWVATVTTDGFTTGTGTPAETIPATAVAYWSGPATATVGDGTFLPGQPTATDAVPLSGDPTAFSKSSGDGGNSVSWTPTVTVHVPTSAVAGSYTGTVTHSVA